MSRQAVNAVLVVLVVRAVLVELVVRVLLAARSARTNNNFEPHIAMPLNAASLVTDALPLAAGENSTSHTYPNSTLGLAFSDSREQGWTLDPATDSDQLRCLRALHRYGTGQIPTDDHESEFKCEYPIQTRTDRTLRLRRRAPLRRQRAPILVGPGRQPRRRGEALRSRA